MKPLGQQESSPLPLPDLTLLRKLEQEESDTRMDLKDELPNVGIFGILNSADATSVDISRDGSLVVTGHFDG